MKGKILVVDDEEVIRKALVKLLESEGYTVLAAEDAFTAIEKIKEGTIDLLLTDLKMPGKDGIQLIAEAKQVAKDIVCIVMTGYGTISSAVDAVKAGAYHYVTKPFQLDDVTTLVARALEHRTLQAENIEFRKQVKTQYSFSNIVGRSDAICQVFEVIKKVADTDSTILLLGESGTGKELFARALHYNSSRAKKPLITVNCGAIPENLLETELFGHVKGAFTGAVQTKIGRMVAAHEGSVFLDEIGEMSPRLQVKLLRVLQERRIEPVGSTHTQEIDVRIIAATHRNLEELVRRGEFREDLYYRLNVIPVRIPTLRERSDDVPMLVDYFLNLYCKENKLEPPIFSKDVMALLSNYDWPGNVRELENTIERLVVLKSGKNVEISDFPDKFKQQTREHTPNPVVRIPDSGISFKQAVREFENGLILKALEMTNWNKNKAAHLLKLNRTTLVEKIKKKQLQKSLMFN